VIFLPVPCREDDEAFMVEPLAWLIGYTSFMSFRIPS